MWSTTDGSLNNHYLNIRYYQGVVSQLMKRKVVMTDV